MEPSLGTPHPCRRPLLHCVTGPSRFSLATRTPWEKQIPFLFSSPKFNSSPNLFKKHCHSWVPQRQNPGVSLDFSFSPPPHLVCQVLSFPPPLRLSFLLFIPDAATLQAPIISCPDCYNSLLTGLPLPGSLLLVISVTAGESPKGQLWLCHLLAQKSLRE